MGEGDSMDCCGLIAILKRYTYTIKQLSWGECTKRNGMKHNLTAAGGLHHRLLAQHKKSKNYVYPKRREREKGELKKWYA